jgi:RNA polymerase sigma-70 factor (ECF subfamily)
VEGRPLDESELVERAIEGDIDAYSALVQRYEGIAFRTAYFIARSAADAEEAAQEAFVKAFYSLRSFRREAPFRPWLLKIVANEASNKRRSAGRRQGLALRVAEAGSSGGAAPSPEAAALAGEQQALLLEAVDGLKERDRTVIVLRYFLELSEIEMAEVLGVARGTVKSRLSRALDRLRTRLPAAFVAEITGVAEEGSR